jgi:peptide/nickel transport system substrate-binding protein
MSRPRTRAASQSLWLAALFVVLLVVLVVGTGAAAFGSSTPTPMPISADGGASPGAEPVDLRIGWTQDVDNLSPFIGLQGTDYMLWHLNYDFLVGFDAETLDPKPELATAWEVSADGLTWTFTIRSDATWQDGVPVTAKDVAFTFNYIIENDLLNLAVYTAGITEAVAVDDTTVQITTKAPKANMLRMVVPILPEHIWSTIDGEDAATSYGNPPPIVGSGPFQIVEWQKGRYVKLVANPTYWGGKPKVDELYFELYTNPDTMTQDLKLGTIDGAIDVPPAQFAQIGTTEGLYANNATSWRFVEIGMNCYESPDSMGNPALLDEKLRQAINWAVDREKVVSVAAGGYATVGSTLIPPYSPYHWQPGADQLFTYDPAMAGQLLDEAGYKDVDGDGYREATDGTPLSLRFYATSDSPENQTAAKLIVGWLKDVGVKLKLQVMDTGALLDAQYNYKGDTYAPDYDLFIWYWTQDVDPQFQLSIYTPQQIEGWNDCLWTDPEYTKLNEEQSTTIGFDGRKPIIDQMQQLFYEAAPYAILTYPFQLEAYNTADWSGWVHVPGNLTGEQEGAVLYSYNNIDTYRFVEPVVAATSTGSEESSSSTTWLIIGGVAALVVILIIVLLVRRGRGRAVESE